MYAGGANTLYPSLSTFLPPGAVATVPTIGGGVATGAVAAGAMYAGDAGGANTLYPAPMSTFLPSGAVAPASTSSGPMGMRPSLMSAFLPSGLALSAAPPGTSQAPSSLPPSATVPLPATQSCADDEAAPLLPSPPTSPPDGATDAHSRSSAAVSIHPLTLCFSSAAVEAQWRGTHARTLLGLSVYILPVLPSLYLAAYLRETNEGARLLLLAWAVGCLPAIGLVLYLHGTRFGDGTSTSRLPRLLDAAAASLCILPQLCLTVWTWRAGGVVANPMDAFDVSNGADDFGKQQLNWLLAILYLRANCTDPAVSLLALAMAAALRAVQSPLSTTPTLELAMCRKGAVMGLVGGYFLEHTLRSRFRDRRAHYTPLPRHWQAHPELRSLAGAPAAPDAAPAAAPMPHGAVATASAAKAAGAGAVPGAGAQGVRMHPVTRRFSSPAVEAEYRYMLFVRSFVFLKGLMALGVTMHLVAWVDGEACLTDTLVNIACLLASFLPRIFVHHRGERRGDLPVYGRIYLVMVMGQLLYRVVGPSPAGGGRTNDSLDVFFFPYPLLFLIHGTEAPYCWLLSLAAVVVSFSSSSSSWRNDARVDGAVLRSTVMGAEALAFVADVIMRARFRSK